MMYFVHVLCIFTPSLSVFKGDVCDYLSYLLFFFLVGTLELAFAAGTAMQNCH